MSDKSVVFFGSILAVVVLVIIGVFGVSYYSEDTHTGCVVTDKDRTRNMDSSGSEMRVYTENCGTFQVADTLVKGKFNSADTFGALKAGNEYDLTTIGFRFGLTSSFPNIIEAVPSE